ncbi:putative Abc transporter [Leptomonas pyrrhocoris]|uniref:Putative Abc transporter n=1 Tax=Leptomonas pyrrhocoris TaxID=157538 RepID=A0A0N0VGA5_LEPPY|nr:putative Abc transporter [Leptomonas pyrrhocoris]KPA83154.1 putative Abc transporter [Leptomonas pyrrhocoris]|eukprot:XP_015661593.1 putative Abc transporter [Leptomonas pyrrhocoris]
MQIRTNHRLLSRVERICNNNNKKEMMPQSGIINVRGVSFRYPDAAQPALKEVNLTVNRGDRILVIGHNGSGKSTLLSLLAGRRMPHTGSVRVLNGDPFDDTSMAQHIALIGAPWPPEAVFGNTVGRVAAPAPLPERKAAVAEALHLRLSRFVDKMSSGEKRRVQILHGLLRPATVYLLDECSTDIDLAERRTVLDLVKRECEEREGCCLYATHILDRIQGWATHLLLFENGEIVELRPVTELQIPLEEYAFQFMSQCATRDDVSGHVKLSYGKFSPTSTLAPLVEGSSAAAVMPSSPTLPIHDNRTYWRSAETAVSSQREVVIDCSHLSYKDIFRDMSFQVFRGERVLLCGVNGAGKTTLLNMLGGKQFFDNGNGALSVLGKRCYEDMLLNGLVSYGGDWWTVVPGGEMHVHQLLQIKTARAEHLRSLLAVQMDWDVRHISAGEQKRVQLLFHLLEDNPIVLLDEATADLDVDQRHSLLQFLYEESTQRGVTVVYSTHIFGGLEGWASTAVLLDRTARGVHAVYRELPGAPLALNDLIDEIVALKAKEVF